MTRLLIVGGLVLIFLVGLGCLAGIAFYVNRLTGTRPASEEAIHEAQTEVLNFMDDIRDRNDDTAYGRTSAAFRGRQSREQFGTWIDRYPKLRQSVERDVSVKRGAVGNSIKYEVVLGEKGRSDLKMSITVVKEGGEWKVDALSVP